MSSLIQNPYADFLAEVEKPARYIGGEHFSIRKSWDESIFKMALCFPEVYEIGMSHLGFKILYNELNQNPAILAERCFAPWGDMESEMRKRSLPLVSLESFKPLREFDIVGFSLQFELTYPNVLNMLDMGQIPLWAHEREEHDPFVIAGGPCATHPEPVAPFFDFIWIGDAEGLLVEATLFIGKARREGWKRLEILKAIAHWPGIYIPAFYQTDIDSQNSLEIITGPLEKFEKNQISFPIKRHIVSNLQNFPFPIQSPIPHATAIFDKFSIELSRGCTEGCRFCQAGMIYRPIRERDPQTVIHSIMQGLQENGYQEASLTCLSTADYSAITPMVIELLDKMKEQQSSLGIASLRAYGLDERVLDKMAEVKNSSFTFAPEAGTERMRHVINKNISETDMLSTAEKIFSRGWQKMKLYFMIGLPTETDEDVVGIMDIANKTRLVAKKLGVKNAQINVSVSSFVPKPHTPFQWASMISYDEIERKQSLLWEQARNNYLGFRRHHSKSSVIEGVLARGDRRLASVIFDVWKAGARFDGWDEGFRFSRWEEAFTSHNININHYLGELAVGSTLPWSHIDIGVEDKYLEREWKKAQEAKSSLPCGKIATSLVHFNNVAELEQAHHTEKKSLVCYHCGVECDLKEMVDSRKTFLSSLKANDPTLYERPKTSTVDPLSLRPKRGQNVGYRYRLEFSKIGALTFISHLDLQKVLARVLKRSQLNVLYSEGHNPKPLLSFGPALPLGINSLSEFMDIRSPEEWSDVELILKQFQHHSERGLVFQRVDAIPHKSDSLQESIQSYDYFFPFINADQDCSEKLKTLLQHEELIIASSYLNKEQERDVRPFILEMKREPLHVSDDILALLHEVTPCAHRQGIVAKIKVNRGQTIRPREILSCLQQFDIQTYTPIKLKTNL